MAGGEAQQAFAGGGRAQGVARQVDQVLLPHRQVLVALRWGERLGTRSGDKAALAVSLSQGHAYAGVVRGQCRSGVEHAYGVQGGAGHSRHGAGTQGSAVHGVASPLAHRGQDIEPAAGAHVVAGGEDIPAPRRQIGYPHG